MLIFLNAFKNNKNILITSQIVFLSIKYHKTVFKNCYQKLFLIIVFLKSLKFGRRLI